MSEWIPHDGGPMPVPANTLIRVQFRCETQDEALRDPWNLGSAGAGLEWQHDISDTNAGSGDIIAYRLETPNEDQ